MTSHQKKRIPYIDYKDLFMDNHERIISQMKETHFYSKGTDGEGNLLEEVIKHLKVDIKNVKDISLPSPFMYLFLSEKNGKNFGMNSYGFVPSIKRGFFKERTPMKEFLPLTYEKLKSAMEIFENSQKLTKIPDNQRNISLLGRKIDNNWESIIKEIEDKYFRDSKLFFELTGVGKIFILSSYFDLTRIKNDLELYNIRFSIISNLRKNGGANSFLEAVSYKVVNRIDGQDTFYLPININNLPDKSTAEVLGKEYEVGRDVDNSASEFIEYLVIDGPENFSIVKEHLITVSFLDVDIKINKAENILVYQPGRNDTKELEHAKRKKIRGWGDGNLSDYTWKPATQTVKELTSDIVPLISNKKDKPEVSSFVLSCLESVYSFSTLSSKEAVFMKSWFVIERIASAMVKPKKKKGDEGSYNKRIEETINMVVSLSGDKIHELVLEEMIVYRNALIHGGNPSDIRVGAYGTILNIVISYVIQYLAHNIDLLDDLSMKEVLETMFYRENIV